MKCPEVRNKLFPFLDNELDVQDNLNILTHLDLCPRCSECYESEKQLEELYKEKLEGNFDPQSLWQKIKPQLNPVRPQKFWTYSLKRGLSIAGSAIAASLIVSFALVTYLSAPKKLDAETLVNQTVQLHQQLLDGKLPSQIPTNNNQDFEKARSYLYQKSGVYVCNHDLSNLGYSPNGARLCSCNVAPHSQLASIVYIRGQNRLSHFIINDSSILFPENNRRWLQGTRFHYYIYRIQPFKVIAYRNGRNLCLFVVSMNRGQVKNLVQTLARQMPTDDGASNE